MAWLFCKHFRDRLEHLENLQSSSFARLLLDSMNQAESTLFSTVTGTHPLRTSSAAGALAPEQMCCDWQLLAVQPSAQGNGARPCTLAATKRQLSHFLSTNRRNSLFVTSGEQCWLFRTGAGDGNSVQRFCVQELECSHEEADTKILLHAQHAAEAGHRTVSIRSPDTDVAIIAVDWLARYQPN